MMAPSSEGVEAPRNNTMIESLVSGALSSTLTTITYQPLELLKTKIQLQGNRPAPYVGRLIESTSRVMNEHNLGYLWRGTGASLLRSVPGIGLYYASLNILQTNLSEHSHKPDSAMQAFCFGLTARSIVSFILLPITVVKVRYESGQYKYSSLLSAVKDAYLRTGWIGGAPTILRDSLFSGIYYMSYTKLKSYKSAKANSEYGVETYPRASNPVQNFTAGIISGLVASIITNPIDVLKTTIQVDKTGIRSMRETVILLRKKQGYMFFLSGLFPRTLRRTLVATTTWTSYEILMDSMRRKK